MKLYQSIFEDLDFVNEGVKINIKRSKTDQFGEGMVKGLPYFNNKIYCPVNKPKKWLKYRKLNLDLFLEDLLKV